MREAGHEHDALAPGDVRLGGEGIEGIGGDRARICCRLECAHAIGLILRGIQHHVDVPPQLTLQRFHAYGLLVQFRVAQDIGFLAHAPEMQIVPIEHHARTRVLANHTERLARHVGARQQDRIEVAVPVVQQATQSARPAHAMHHLHAHRLQARRVHRIVIEVVRPELHHAPCLDQPLHEGQHGPRACVPVVLRHVVIDDQHHRTLPRAIARTQDVLAIGVVLLQQLLPTQISRGRVALVLGLRRKLVRTLRLPKCNGRCGNQNARDSHKHTSAPQPFSQSIAASSGVRQHRQMQLPALEFSIKIGHAGVARLWLLAHGTLNDGGQIPIETSGQLRRVFEYRTHLRTCLHAGERPFTTQQPASQCCESINVGGCGTAFTAHLFGCRECQGVADAGGACVGLQ